MTDTTRFENLVERIRESLDANNGWEWDDDISGVQTSFDVNKDVLAEAIAKDLLDSEDEANESYREDALKWRAVEAEGHTAEFSETGYGLRHPPSCRPDLIGCRYNQFLSGYGEPVKEPGLYQMTWPDDADVPTFEAVAS